MLALLSHVDSCPVTGSLMLAHVTCGARQPDLKSAAIVNLICSCLSVEVESKNKQVTNFVDLSLKSAT